MLSSKVILKNFNFEMMRDIIDAYSILIQLSFMEFLFQISANFI